MKANTMDPNQTASKKVLSGSIMFANKASKVHQQIRANIESALSLQLSQWYPGLGVVLDCIDS